ncbi:hypothetical protein DRO58_05640 [Candidatus Bathyarchaeota archaeon]|nr:MAG: hypothetical protein DRO58_05640 [Candidatus Bathyarchaeota archaeon]
MKRLYVLLVTVLAVSTCLNAALYLHFTAEISWLKAEVDENRRGIDAVAAECSRLKAELSELAGSTEEALEQLRSRLNATSSALQLLGEQLQVLESTTREELAALKENGSRAWEALRTINSSMSALSSRVSRLSLEVQKVDAEAQAAKGNVSELRDDVSSLQAELQSVRSDVSRLWLNITSIWRELAREAGYWSSLSELEEWLGENRVDENEYIPGLYDCDDFAVDLARAALREENKLVFPIPVYYGEVYKARDCIYISCRAVLELELPDGNSYLAVANHMVDLTYCEDVGWVLVEPQTDGLWVLGTHEL